MENDDARELLIRIDERMESIDSRLHAIEHELASRQCQVHGEKLRTLERMVWGAVATAAAAFIKTFWCVR